MQTGTTTTRLTEQILAEVEQEAATTKRLLEIIPEDKLDWRPHPKAKSLGELAMHVACSQGMVAECGDRNEMASTDFRPEPTPANRGEILDAFAESLSKVKEIVGATSDEKALAEWRLVHNGATMLTMPRMGVWRTVMCNHIYHHRGQLSTYLRQLDVPLPSIYGPSADENPFA